MKGLRKIMMKRRRRRSTKEHDIVFGLDSPKSSSSSSERSFWRRRPSDSVLTDETTTSSFATDDAPWRTGTFSTRSMVLHFSKCPLSLKHTTMILLLLFRLLLLLENILTDGSPRASDWWEDKPLVGDPSCCSLDSESLSTEEGSTEKKFRNRGLETWLQSRKAWKESGTPSSYGEKEKGVVSSSPRVLSSSLRRELAKNLSDNRRQYTLPKRISLGTMIGVYQTIWNGDD